MTSGIPLLLVGGGGHCRAVIDVVEQDGRFRIAGIIDKPDQVGRTLYGHEVIGTDADLPGYAGQYRHAIVTVGQIKTPAPRQRLFHQLRTLGYDLPSIVSPTALVSKHAKIGAGTIVMHRAVINAGVDIGCNCIINTAAIVEHDCRIAADVHLAVGSILCGAVSIGQGAFIGAGAICREGITVGENAIVGLGTHLLHDCAPNSICRSN